MSKQMMAFIHPSVTNMPIELGYDHYFNHTFSQQEFILNTLDYIGPKYRQGKGNTFCRRHMSDTHLLGKLENSW